MKVAVSRRFDNDVEPTIHAHTAFYNIIMGKDLLFRLSSRLSLSTVAINQVVCGVCHSYSGHLYEQLGAELGILDGMTMKSAFCEELVDACSGQITFPTYDGGEDYCEKHTGGGDDFFWSYPYEERTYVATCEP